MSIRVVFFDLGETLVTGSRQWVSGAPQVLFTLRDRGVRLGIISDTGSLTRPQLLDLLPTDFDLQLFEPDLVLLSSETGIEKPDIRIFLEGIRRAAVSPIECLFCTENLAHAMAAQRVQMRSARVLPPANSDLSSLLDLVGMESHSQ